MRKPYTMPCSRCAGTGHVELPSELLTSLRWLQKGPLTALALHTKMGSFGVVTAANNRLEELRRLGYATRQKKGRVVTYTFAGRR